MTSQQKNNEVIFQELCGHWERIIFAIEKATSGYIIGEKRQLIEKKAKILAKRFMKTEFYPDDIDEFDYLATMIELGTRPTIAND